MSYQTKQWICFLLFRLILPLTQLTAAIVRFSGFSLLYGCLALVTPLLRRPTCYSMAHHTGRYLTIAVVLCTVTALSQIGFQLFTVIAPAAHYDYSWLSNCSTIESALRQIGLQQVKTADAVNGMRIVLPDIAVFFVTTVVFVVCRMLLRHPPPVDLPDSLGQNPLARTSSRERERRRLFKYGVMVADFAGNFCVVMMLGAVAIALPSIANSIYFVLFIFVVTMWACCVKLGRWFSILRVLILLYVGAHLIAIHLSQFQFAQQLWEEQKNGTMTGNDTMIERILGLPRFVEVDCHRPWAIVMRNVKWTYYLDVGLLLFFYFVLAFEIRRKIEPRQMATELATNIAVPEEYVNPAAPLDPETHVCEESHPGPAGEKQGLIADAACSVPNYHSVDPVREDPGISSISQLPDITASADLSDTDRQLCRRHSHHDKKQKLGAAAALFQFISRQSYVGTLIIMMLVDVSRQKEDVSFNAFAALSPQHEAWSVVYHSWLTFVLLIAACLIWIVPQKRLLCLRCSPLIVFYAICLLIIQYVYGFNLFDSELPIDVSGYHLAEIGLVKYDNPVGPLAAQIAFALVFWLTLRQFMWECVVQRLGSQLEAESLDTLNETDEQRRQRQDSMGVKALKTCGNWLYGMLCKYWIFFCAALFLLMALLSTNVYRIIYMVFFLYFVITFQLCYSYWRYCIKAFWWIVILYSMVVLVFIYVFQFKDILANFKNETGMPDTLASDLGLVTYDQQQLLLQLLTPTSFLIFIILHLHYFQNKFLQISDVNRYKAFDGSTADLQPSFEDSSDIVNQGDCGSTWLTIWYTTVQIYEEVTKMLWRIGEIHIHKAVIVAIFVHCCHEVCAINVVYVVLLVVMMPFPNCYTIVSHICQLYTSVVIVAKMLYQLRRVPIELFESNCTEIRGMNTSGGIPFPFNGTIDTAQYIGLQKTDVLADYVKDYIIIVILLAVEAIIRVHQEQFYNHPDHARPPSGIVFAGITREHADQSLENCAKFLVNYCFFKFGREICFIMTVVTMVVRLDLYSVIYGACLGILVLLSRHSCYRLWRCYVILLMVLLIVQYLSALGAPLALCWEYPWTSVSENLKIFLYLPSFTHKPDALKLIADFLQLLFVCLQLRVFATESTDDDSDEGGGCNRSVIPSVENSKPNPRADFITYKSSYLDYVKIAVFYYSFWFTLLLVFITGTSRISLFCMGYLIGCFSILWFGQDLLLRPTRTLLRIWTVFMMYCYAVLMAKCCLQLAGCVYLKDLPCVFRQLFSVTCIQGYNYIGIDQPKSPTEEDTCTMDPDNAGLAWDAVSFTFLLIVFRVYKTWYFQHVKTDLEISNLLASRGSEIINVRLFTRVAQRRDQEQSVVTKIRKKMERIKLRHYRLTKSEKEPTDHYVVIRSGDYYMFEEISDDEMEVQTEMSEEHMDLATLDSMEHEQKKPGPLQIINVGFTSGARGAINLWRRRSVSSSDSAIEPEDIQPSEMDDQRPPVSDFDTSLQPREASLDGIEVISSEEQPIRPIVTTGLTSSAHAAAATAATIPEAEPKEAVTTGVTNIFMLLWVVLCASLEKLVECLNRLSFEYRDVSYSLRKEKAQEKAKRFRGLSIAIPEPLLCDIEERPHHSRTSSGVSRPSDLRLRLEEETRERDPDYDGDDDGEQQKQFEQDLPLPLRLVKATFEVLLSHSELLCYFAMVLNALVVGSVFSIVYPILAFLWAMLSEPRPSKVFWVFCITYTEVLIVVKYIFQFSAVQKEVLRHEKHQDSQMALSITAVFGIEKSDTYAAFDLFLLFSLFIHRSILKQHGLWKDAVATSADMRRAETVVASRVNTPATSPKTAFKTISLNPAESSGPTDNADASGDETDNRGLVRFYPDTAATDHECDEQEPDTNNHQLAGCWDWLSNQFHDFHHHLTHPQFSAAADVYAFMFTCDLITFVIVVVGYTSFGPSDSTAGEVVTSVIKQNRVPGPFLAMLLVQFVLTIIDRAIYLRKQVFGKFILQILLVFLVHAWMFFALPAITSRRFTENVVAQLWYFTKCVYFGLSAYQIRCGYPRRILGNFLTKKYNYLNLYCFKGFLVIPFLLELRALMDWMFTDTTLALTSWLQMEDIFANVFCIKCDRHAEKVFPIKRGMKRRAIVKYGLGGLLLFVLIFIIWFPLLLFSLSETIFVPDPPNDVTVNIRFWGYQPLFTMSAQQNWVKEFTKKDYDNLYEQLKDEGGQSFLLNYNKEDIYKAEIDGTSGSTWDISPPNIDRLYSELTDAKASVSIYVTVSFTRDPSPGLQTETVSGQFVRLLNRSDTSDNQTMHKIADMLRSPNQNVTVTKLYPHYWTVPAKGKATETREFQYVSGYAGDVELELKTDNTTAKWWRVYDAYKSSTGTNSSITMSIISFNQRIAPSSVLSMATSYGVIGLYVSLVLVIGQFVRMWVQGLSFRIMFVELPNPDLLLKLCLDIYMVRESGELTLEEDLFSQLIFLYRSPETLIKVTKRKLD